MMELGMLWLDNDEKRPFDEKVERAADYYLNKYGRLPELCLVNQQQLAETKKVGKVRVEPGTHLQRHHFWLGMSR